MSQIAGAPAERVLGPDVDRAPFAGALQTRAVEVGDFVKAGDPIATFVDNRTIIVSANVSEFDAGYVAVGQSAEAKLATGGFESWPLACCRRDRQKMG